MKGKLMQVEREIHVIMQNYTSINMLCDINIFFAKRWYVENMFEADKRKQELKKVHLRNRENISHPI